jgi:hypothetical protein
MNGRPWLAVGGGEFGLCYGVMDDREGFGGVG